MQMTQVVLDCIKTAYVERLNATLRTWMPSFGGCTHTPLGACAQLEVALLWAGCVCHFHHMYAILADTPTIAVELTAYL